MPRITGGSLGSRKLRSPKGAHVRPTPGRVKESLFSILMHRLEGARVLDAFAGSGALGLEALSRGAADAVFLDQDLTALECLRRNVQDLGEAARAILVKADALKPPTRDNVRGRPALRDLVFLDPPYDDADEYEVTLGWLGRAGRALLTDDAMVVAEHRKKQLLAARYGSLQRYRLLEQGDAALSFFTVPSAVGDNVEKAS